MLKLLKRVKSMKNTIVSIVIDFNIFHGRNVWVK